MQQLITQRKEKINPFSAVCCSVTGSLFHINHLTLLKYQNELNSFYFIIFCGTRKDLFHLFARACFALTLSHTDNGWLINYGKAFAQCFRHVREKFTSHEMRNLFLCMWSFFSFRFMSDKYRTEKFFVMYIKLEICAV